MGEDQKNPEAGPVLHVLVVGFHHKKGCQVEYSYPPLVTNGATECPPGWKYLPTLALPDGSHNYDQDTVFFHLPGLNHPNETVFGISCFRQIPVEKLKNKTSDITRGTVQKAVCVLSSVPLYGHIQVKMELITHAYFDEGDFTKVSLLEDTYHHLNGCLNQIEDLHQAPQLFVGLPARELVLTLRHKVLVLYKLLLLEKKILFFQSPVQPLCSTILSLLSLHPGMIEKGLYESACIRASRPMSPIPQFSEASCPSDVTKLSECPDNMEGSTINGNSGGHLVSEISVKNNSDPSELNGNLEEAVKVFNGGSLSRDTSSVDLASELNVQNTLAAIAQIDAEHCGLPLKLFSNGYLCLPYLSLPYMDVLTDPNIRGYVVGATNVLFKQKKNLADVLVELESGVIESCDPELRRAAHLSTEDLRFGEYLVRHVSDTCYQRGDYLDGVGWEGGDDWVRAQFHAYTLSLLRTSILPDGSKEIEQFNKWYITALQSTHSYKEWLSNPNSQNISEIASGHPFAGHLSVADMKLRLAHTMQTTEGGRKVTQAMASTGRAVATTGRAVGGAISQAKGALSNWFSNLVTVAPGQAGVDASVEQACDAIEEESPPPT